MYERLVSSSKWGLIFQVKAQAQVEQLCSTLTLLLILIVNMTSNKLRTRWASTLPKLRRSFRPSKKLCTERITKQRQFKKLKKGQKSRLKRYQKTMKVISPVKVQRTQKELLCNILELFQTWTSGTRTSTKRLWWNLTRPKLLRSSRLSNRYGKARTMTLKWLIRHRISQANRVIMLLNKLQHQSLAHRNIATSPSTRATTTAVSWLEQTPQLKTWTLPRCRWLLHKRNRQPTSLRRASLAPCSILIILPKQDRTICQRSRPSNVIHREMRLFKQQAKPIHHLQRTAKQRMSTLPCMDRYKWALRLSKTYVRLARTSKQ